MRIFKRLRAAVEIADELVGAPARWQARSALGEVAYGLGEDDTAATAYAAAAELVDGFAQSLSPDRAARFLAAPAVQEMLARGVTPPSRA